jgi:hypothetical protein
MSTPAWISALPSGVVHTDLAADAASGVFSYADALQLMLDVENAGQVTASEFSALQSVAANLNNGLTSSAYVASIFTQFVDGSPANADWTGGMTGATIPVGDLASGMSAQNFDYLIGQWFLGTNLPDPTPPSGSGYTVTGYSPISGTGAITGPLYDTGGASGAASVDDVVQGGDGDCELMSGLIEMVVNHPQQLASMIVSDGNGDYGVRFYVDGNEVWETVNDQLPVDNGQLVFAGNPNEQITATWVALVEKAYVQLSGTGLIDHPAVNSYENINSDAAYDVLPNLTNASVVNYFNYNDANFNAEKPWYIDAVASGDDVFVETGYETSDQTFNSTGQNELVSDHAFAVVGYDATTGDFILRNPWGVEQSQTWVTQFEVSLSQIAGVQGDFAIDNTGTDNSTMTVVYESGTILAGAATSLAGFFQIDDSTGAATSEYNLQLLGGGSIQLNGATNLATSAETAAGQIVVSAADLAKITFSAASGAGQQDLLVSAYDGAAWSATADIQLQIASSSVALNPRLDALVAAGGDVSVSSLFATSGVAATYYAFIVPTGGGAIDLNGATNDWGNSEPQGGTGYEVSAGQLSLLTYVAPTTGGAQTLQGQAYDGSNWSPWQNIQVNVGVGASAALLDYANGQVGTGATVIDTAANIFANLGALQSAFTAGELTAIGVTDTTLQHESLGQAQYAADHGLISILQGEVAVTEIVARDNFLAAGLSDYLIENTSGVVAVGQVGAGGQAAYTVVSDIGPEWTFEGNGNFLGDGADQFLIENTAGAVDVGSISGGTATYEQVSGLGPEWSFKETGAFLGLGDDQFIIENTAGSLAVGNVVSGEADYTVIGALGSEWKFVGAGDFLGEGHDQFLIENSAGAVVVGDVENNQAVYTVVASLGPEWTFEGSGAFLGTPGAGSAPKSDFLIENTSGAVYIGEVGANDQVTYTPVTSLGSEWKFVGTGDYLDEGHDQFLIENTAGAVVIGDYYGGAVHFTQVSGLGSEWAFHS